MKNRVKTILEPDQKNKLLSCFFLLVLSLHYSGNTVLLSYKWWLWPKLMSSILPLESSCVFIPSAQRPVMRCATSDSHWGTSSRTDPTAPTVNASLQTNTHVVIKLQFKSISAQYSPAIFQNTACVFVCVCVPEMSEYSSALKVSSFSVGRLTKAFMAGK